MGKLYKNAPIVEAILAIHATSAEGIGTEQLAVLGERLPAEFDPKPTKVIQSDIGLKLDEELHATFQPGEYRVLGFRYDDKPGKQVVQFKTDGFSYHKLQPYISWDDLLTKVKGLWPSYRMVATPTVVNRIVLKYINRIEVPFDGETELDLEKYFSTTPKLAEGLSYPMVDFFMRFGIVNEANKANGVVVMTSQPTANGNLPVIFDNEVSLHVGSDINDDALWEKFEILRELKNEIFEKSLTEKTKELFR